MRNAAFTLALLALVAGTSEAQVRSRAYGNRRAFRRARCREPVNAASGIDGVPPGRQPAATNCDQAERIASRNRNARVIYGDDRFRRTNDDCAIAIAPIAA